MKYSYIIITSLFFYFCFVSVKRIVNFALGDPRWHLALFDTSDFPLLDWWIWLIPSLIVSWLLYRYAPRWVIRGVIGLVAAITAFFILISYM